MFNLFPNLLIAVLFTCITSFADTVYIDAGAYTSFPATIQSGTSGNWKVYIGKGQKPSDVSIRRNGDLNISGSYIIFENMAFGQQEGLNGGENVHLGGVHHIQFKKCRFFSVNTGTLTRSNPQTGDLLKFSQSNDILVEDCEFVNENSLVRGSVDQYWDNVNVHNVICRNNYFHDLYFSASACVQFKGGSYNVIIENCVFDSIGEASALRFGGGTGDQWIPDPAGAEGWDMTARNNVFINCPEQPVDVYNARDIRIYNNTFIGCGGFGPSGTWESGAGILKAGGNPDLLTRAWTDSIWFINNLMWNPNGDLKGVLD
ncbi:MAG: hypothetical protein ABIA63_15275, partial [bacterium]